MIPIFPQLSKTQLTLILKSSWKCFFHLAFPFLSLLNPEFIIWKLFWGRVNISLILACIHCLSSFHCTPLIGTWLWLFHTHPVFTASNESAHHPPLSKSSHPKAEQAQLPQPPLLHHGLQALAILVGLCWSQPKELLFILSRELQSGCRTPDAVSEALTNQSVLLVCWTCICQGSPRHLWTYSNKGHPAELQTPFQWSCCLEIQHLACTVAWGYSFSEEALVFAFDNFKSPVTAHFSSRLRISLLPYLPGHWLLPCIWQHPRTCWEPHHPCY